MNFKQKLLSFLFLIIYIIPINIYAYSDKVILGGDNIGISVNTKEVLVVGFYKVNDKYIAKEAGFAIGDKILKVNDNTIKNIDDLIKEINKSDDSSITIRIKRNNEEKKIKLKLIKENGIYKTGLYIKDQITGVGTLTYIDPATNIFASLGHEISDNKTGKIIDIRNGNIFESKVTGVIKTTDTKTGEKKAKFIRENIEGIINKNTTKGIYGIYTKENNNILIEVGNENEIVLGPAKIYTCLNNNKIEAYDINIIKVNKSTDTKNILFEITDKRLINEAGGIIKGMSGSPIVQNNKIIGAVTHAILSENTKGYGIFITTMLEEGEK